MTLSDKEKVKLYEKVVELRHCKICGISFVCLKKHNKCYCGPNCKQKDFYRKQKVLAGK